MVSQAELDLIRSKFMSLPTRDRFVILEEKLKRKRSLKTMREILIEYLTGDIEKFTYNLNGHLWHGFQYKAHNSMMGSVFSYYDKKLTILRGYPKIRYVDDADILDKEGYQERKLDGTNLNVWSFHDGILFGKSRLGWEGMEGYIRESWYYKEYHFTVQ
jgi:hypothetical protein